MDINLERISQIDKDGQEYLQELLDQLYTKNGLDYVPRERTPQGRMFEHASDSRILLKLLQSAKLKEQKEIPATSEVFYIKIENEINNDNLQVNGTLTSSTSVSSNISNQDETLLNSNKQDKKTILSIKRRFITLTLNANGKADLYFHAYIWISIFQQLFFSSKSELTEQEFDNEIVTKSVEIKRLKGLVDSFKKVDANLSKFPFNKEIYDKFVQELGSRKQSRSRVKFIEDIQRSLFVAQISDDKKTLYWIEKILIQLLGYHDISIRDQAVILLNMLYDGIDWQLTQAFRPVVRVVGQHFKVSLIVNLDLSQKDNQNSQIFIGLSAPSPIEGINKTILTWHKIEKRNIVQSKGIETEIFINFGKFWKCGFYDWRVVLVRDTGRLQPLEIIGKPEPNYPTFKSQQDDPYGDDDLGSIAQGRFIVHAKGIRDQSFHEVQVDFQNADIDTKQGTILKRGDFQKVEKSIESYKSRGITALYLMGVLERDNYAYVDKSTNQVEFRKPDCNPLAITCRETANKMLGGDEGFQRVMNQAKQSKVKIIIDCLSRISSARNHRKYRNLMLHYLDELGIKKICYGTDGQAINYEDTALLNYRKIESWNLLIDEVVNFTQKYGINGIHLDNGQAWPQIMEPDMEELLRLDVDGQPAYTADEVMNGDVVIRNENHGYWHTSAMENYPNPFFIKMAKTVWEKNPDFMIIGECWGGYMFENRQIILSRSGVIPRLFKLPQTISSVFGKKLMKDGRVVQSERQDVLALKKWYESNRLYLPEGSILLQSSSAHQWPYPAYLYGKGTWAAVDILFFMPDIPITYMGEIDGEVYKIGTTQLFQHEQQTTPKAGLKRTNSQLMMALQQKDEHDDYIPQKHTPEKLNSPDGKRGLPRVRSGSNLAAVVVEQTRGQDLKVKEEQFKANMGPLQGFDLSKISSHYEHRRRLRREKMVLRYGELIPLIARHQNGWHNHVLAYARYSLLETAIISTNLNDSEVNFYIDTSALQKLYEKNYNNNTVIMITDCLHAESLPQYYFLREYLQMKHFQSLKPYHSSIHCLTICQDDSFVMKKALTQSIERTKQKLLNGENIESEQISLLFTDILERTPEDTIKFADVVGSLQESFLDKLSMTFNDLFVNNNKLKSDPLLASRLLALCQRIVEIADDSEIAPKKAAMSVLQSNKLGPIVFCAPELGRWSTVGGLGVMVDELSIGLAALGQDVYVISPYYERNRKGETGYLAKDPAGITYTGNISVSVGAGITLGVHEGVVSGVKVVFLHNGDIFPSPYPDLPAIDIMRQLAVFGKGCLEYCCSKAMIPSVCVTNDWFTGLIPGYAKIGAFGQTFKGTTFLHIAHNLEPTYEGRLHPTPQQGALEFVHQLPRDWLVDPLWGTCIVNPSRCGVMLSDQWATVSPSYKEDLLRTSSLKFLLQQKPQPFAFPNGIPVQARLKKLNDAAPDHLSAKRIIQMKYFGYQDLDDEVCLMSFVGRITEQKGVHLILDAAEQLIIRNNYRINILVGGMASMKEKYAADCAHKMWHLKNKYPNCFWADPNYFFTDGSVVNRGSDYGLMPSIFEPGGIVQHEFFVGSTPVVAFKTGGLKDSVFEYMWDTEKGNGYTFESHTVNDFIFACERALGTYKNKAKYLKLRENAFNSTMDGEVVSKAWLKEFYRLRGKVYVEDSIIQDALNKMKPWAPEVYKPMHSFEQLFGLNQKLDFKLDDIDLGAEEEKEVHEEEKVGGVTKKVVSHFEQGPRESDRFPHVFMMHNQGPKYTSVELCGTMDDWKVRHPMNFDHFTNQWFITLHLKQGKYLYKYVVNDKNWVINEKEPMEKDSIGNINNVLTL